MAGGDPHNVSDDQWMLGSALAERWTDFDLTGPDSRVFCRSRLRFGLLLAVYDLVTRDSTSSLDGRI